MGAQQEASIRRATDRHRKATASDEARCCPVINPSYSSRQMPADTTTAGRCQRLDKGLMGVWPTSARWNVRPDVHTEHTDTHLGAMQASRRLGLGQPGVRSIVVFPIFRKASAPSRGDVSAQGQEDVVLVAAHTHGYGHGKAALAWPAWPAWSPSFRFMRQGRPTPALPCASAIGPAKWENGGRMSIGGTHAGRPWF